MATFNRSDIEFILTQIKMAEAGQPPVNPHLSFGLRQVNGQNNSSVPGQSDYGSADQLFPRMSTPVFQNADVSMFGPPTSSSYAQTNGNVFDSDPRTISNLISDQSAGNPAAVEAANAAADALGTGYQYNVGTPTNATEGGSLFINNVTPDNGLSAPFNTWMTLFGQFFDHGLDFANKGGNGTVFIPLQKDDPLYVEGGHTNFMVLTRATMDKQPGADGVMGTADDVQTHEATNSITPFVDQNQTYSSHPSHQVFLREYVLVDGKPHATGRLLDSSDGNHHMPTWADVKAQAKNILGIELRDTDVADVPLLATDEYGNFIPGEHGFPQMILVDANRTVHTIEGNLAQPVSTTQIDANNQLWKAVPTGHAFLNDIAHSASPFSDSGAVLTADIDTNVGNQPLAGFYDNELLDKHYIAGDGRANENVGLTAVHEVFHSEHNRMLEQVKSLVVAELASGDMSFASEWLMPGTVPTSFTGTQAEINALQWNGERLFQVAKFGTETQYQHLVFEEFARKIAPTIHLFGNNDINLDPAITAEFAHAVYRFGHSMLDENLNRYEIGADGTPVIDPATGQPKLNAIGLIEAFTNPLAYANQGANAAGEIVLGAVNQIGNEIDEFVTGALRNNLLGLPLDLGAINIARGRETGVPPINLLRNELYSKTHDTALKPYESWDEFGQFLKHPASLINFVAAYGEHTSITSATTLAGKRAAALDLVSNSMVGSDHFSQDAFDFIHSQGAYASNKADTRAIHDATGAIPTWSTGSVTGVDHVDLWIGGLAEKQTLFGGLLGSTFNYIFENQLEALQDADRLYYLPRIEGMHWAAEIEGNSFAEMIMRNTGTHHLSGSIFLTPEYSIEASTIDKNDPSTWLRNPETGKLLVDVMNDGTIRFIGDDNFLGNTIVLGGTEGDDRLLAGQADDDTVWGDGGNDYIDGGNGNDFLFGGTGDDYISDSAGNDSIHGDEGNDTILAGIGDDLVFGNDGDDYIDGGQGIDAINGGLGNDIILGGEDDDEIIGNEGDDWIEGGSGGDLMVGDGAAPTGQVPLYSGNDVLDGGAQGDRMQGFTGDDIMLGEGGFDRMEGGLGYDWANYEKSAHGVSVDMNLRQFIPDPLSPAGDAVRDLFQETEAVSGSAYDDILEGTDDALVNTDNELINVNLIDGLSSFFADGPVAYSDGNIMLGGAGSDFITGRGGNDIIDGDAALHVSLTHYGPGGQIIREITNDGQAGDIDTAVFTDVMGNYQWTFGPDEQGFITISHLPAVGGGGGGITDDGTDKLRNIERLQFADGTIDISGRNSTPFGAVVIKPEGDTNLATPIIDPVVGGILTADATSLFDPDTIASDIHLQWQVQDIAKGRWINIAGATSETFTPTTFQNGEALRVMATYVDGAGITERVFSAATSIVAPAPLVNLAPIVIQQQALTGLPDTSAKSGATINLFLPLTTVFSDDHTAASQLVYTAKLANGAALDSVGLRFETIPDGAGGVSGGKVTGTVPGDFLGALDIRVTATDQGGLSTTDTFAVNILPNTINGTEGADVLNGTEAIDRILGKGGDDVIDARGGNDTVDGGAGNDRINGGAGNDSLIGGLGDDTIDGGIGVDSMTGGAGNDTYTVDNTGDVVIELAGEGTDTVRTTLGSYALGSNVEDLVFTGSGNFVGKGNELANKITGGAGNDTIDGGVGNDTMVGGAGNDIYVVDSALDVVTEVLSEGTDTVQTTLAAYKLGANVENLTFIGNGTFFGTGNSLANALTGGTSDDVLDADAGDDLLDGGLGADTMAGGTGDDTYIVDSAGDIVNEAVGAGMDTVRTTLSVHALSLNVENMIYTGTADFVGSGNVLSNTITGGKGNDTLDGGAGTDRLIGGAGDDVYIVDSASDIVVEQAGEGKDTVRTALASYTLGTNVEDLVFTGTASFSGTGNGLNNSIKGAAGNDVLNGGLGADLMEGGNGRDIYFVDNINDVVIETNSNLATGGDDYVYTTVSYTLDDNIEGLNLNSSANINGTGNALNNLIHAGGGVNVIDGRDGIDTLSYFYATTSGNQGVMLDLSVVDNLGQSIASGISGADVIKNIENVLGSNYNDTLTGNASDNYLKGWAGNDILFGKEGNDTLEGSEGDDVLDGGIGADILNGGAGNDVYVVDNSLDIVTEAQGEGTDIVKTTLVSYKLGTNVENLVFTGSGHFSGTGNQLNNQITGAGGNDTLDGLGGNDILLGGVGNDTLNGGSGSDIMDGGDGNDTYFVDDINDVVIETNSNLATGGNDYVYTTVSYTLGDNIEGLNLNSSANINGTGNALNNLIHAGGGVNVIDGRDGIDTLSYFYATTSGNQGVMLDLSVVDNLGQSIASGISGADVIKNIENVLGSNYNDTLTGNASDNYLKGWAGNDILFGKEGNDTLEGSEGDDVLDGGSGADILNGGAGNDVFLFTTNFGHDKVVDFNSNSNSLGQQDWIDLSAFEITNFSSQVSIQTVGGNTLIELEGNSGNSILLIGVNSSTVDQSDFILG